MNALFTPAMIGTLKLPNRLIRSATAERMADADGRPREELLELYRQLATGGVGLIITGHMYVHPTGKCHPEMTGIYADSLIPSLKKLAEAVHTEGGKIAVQINHGGMQCSKDAVDGTIAPSDINEPSLEQPARAILTKEIKDLIDAYAQSARRAKQAGFDAVQIHAAHGYLINQFLSPFINHRTDDWGGNFNNRTRFLKEICWAVRESVGPDYPVFIKLGMLDGVKGGLTLDQSLKVVASLDKLGLDAIEISGGIGGKSVVNVRKGIRAPEDEAYYLPIARQARTATNLPLALVGGFRSRAVMETVLVAGHADFISLCRPLISEPNLPKLFRSGIKDVSRCISSNNCWAEAPGVGIACKCPLDQSETI